MNWVPASKRGGKRDQYRQRFLEMLGAGDLGISWKERLVGDLVLGGNDFVERVRKMLAGDRNEQKPLREMEKPPVDWERITSAIEELWKEVSGRHGDPGRELAKLIAQRTTFGRRTQKASTSRHRKLEVWRIGKLLRL